MTEAMTGCMKFMQRMCTMQMHQQSMLLGNQNARNYILPPSSSPNFSFQQQSLQRNVAPGLAVGGGAIAQACAHGFIWND